MKCNRAFFAEQLYKDIKMILDKNEKKDELIDLGKQLTINSENEKKKFPKSKARPPPPRKLYFN